MAKISYDVISHAAWTSGMDLGEERKNLGLAAVRYYRFSATAKLECLRLYPLVLRLKAIGQPAHIAVEVFDESKGSWSIVAEKSLPEYDGDKPHEIDLHGISARNLKIVCDQEHPAPLDHMEQWKSPSVVPFRILEKLEFYGELDGSSIREPIYNPPIKKGSIQPGRIKGMDVKVEAHQITYKSRYFSVAFSLRRPMVVDMGWDDMGSGLSENNLMADSSVWRELTYLAHPSSAFLKNYYKYSGPSLRLLDQDISARNWTGEVEVKGSKIIYKNLRALDSYSLDVTFEVHEKGMLLYLARKCDADLFAIEADDWQFIWNAIKTITGTMGMPARQNGRTGLVLLPAMLNAPGHGTVVIHEITGGEETTGSKAVKLQVDSWREKCITWAGIAADLDRDAHGAVRIRKGTFESCLAFDVDALAPRIRQGVKTRSVPKGLSRNWSTIFGFRPEMGGFSNNAISVNCHVCQFAVADMAPYTKRNGKCPSMIELLRYTVELALREGPGYTGCRDLYMDSDPSILCSLGRIQQVEPDDGWLSRMWPFIKETCERMLSNIDETGLLLSKLKSGNSGSKQWSCNLWEVVSFGHYDAYSNAMAYRAIRNMTAVAEIAGDHALSGRCKNAADQLRTAYRDCFFNPETGWLGGWRSADGELHDYAFTFINYMAICYGLVEEQEAKEIIERLEIKMAGSGMTYFHLGMPASLMSVENKDVPPGFESKRSDGLDTYGVFLNGCLTTSFMQYYLRALSTYGYHEKADLVCAQLEESFAENRIIGGVGSGKEFLTWEGRACGYEGILVYQFPVLAAIAQHRGIVETLEPEWWIG